MRWNISHLSRSNVHSQLVWNFWDEKQLHTVEKGNKPATAMSNHSCTPLGFMMCLMIRGCCGSNDCDKLRQDRWGKFFFGWFEKVVWIAELGRHYACSLVWVNPVSFMHAHLIITFSISELCWMVSEIHNMHNVSYGCSVWSVTNKS